MGRKNHAYSIHLASNEKQKEIAKHTFKMSKGMALDAQEKEMKTKEEDAKAKKRTKKKKKKDKEKIRRETVLLVLVFFGSIDNPGTLLWIGSTQAPLREVSPHIKEFRRGSREVAFLCGEG